MTIELVILGSGTAVPTPERGAAGYLLIVEDERMMLDCGPGSTRKLAQAGCALNDLDGVMISHFHPDHICDLAAVLFGARIPGYARTRTLTLAGPAGLREHHNRLLNLFGRWLEAEDYKLEFIEFSQTRPHAQFQNCKVVTELVAHSHPAIGYRIETAAGAITYSGDTDYCDAIISLCRDAELAVLECSTPDDEKIKGHLTPALAGKIARQAGVKHLVLSHFYPSCANADILGQCQRQFSGRVTLANDLMRFTLA